MMATPRTVTPAAATVATDDRRAASEITHDVASRETISTPPGETVRPVHNRPRPGSNASMRLMNVSARAMVRRN
jgi:hypothetical protein